MSVVDVDVEFEYFVFGEVEFLMWLESGDGVVFDVVYG